MQPVLFDIDQLSHSYADGKVAIKAISLVIEQGRKLLCLATTELVNQRFFYT